MRYNNVKFEFIENECIGLSKQQIEYIKNLIKEYMEKYSKVVLTVVCDYFSWDYQKYELTKHTYTHNRENEEYKSYDAMASYNDDEKLIGFNHIRLCKMELDNSQIVEYVRKSKQKLESAKKSYERLRDKAKLIGMPIPSFGEIVNQNFNNPQLKSLEIETKDFSVEYFDVLLIRLMERYCTLKRLIIHEFGHAIAYSYNLEEDEILNLLYEKFKEGFEDKQEFLAECFMASELTNEIALANEVRKRINEIVNEKNH